MRYASRDRNGFALMLAMIVMVIIGALVAGALFVSTQEYRISRNTIHQERALAAAEAGMAQALQNWTINPFDQNWGAVRLPSSGDTMSLQYSLPNGSRADVRITRLNMATFLVVSDGATSTTDRQLNARRRTGLLLRERIPALPAYGAFNARGTTNLTGTGTVSGNDVTPLGWAGCDNASTNRPAVASSTTTNVTSGGACAGFTCATGTTAVTAVSALADTNAILSYGDMKYADLVANASKVLSGGSPYSPSPTYNGDGSCMTTDALNWGDPNRAIPTPGRCEQYFPIVHIAGAGVQTVLNLGSGQGILLVDGDLKLNGSFVWVGPVIVRGSISTVGSGNKVIGSIMTANIGCTSPPCNRLAGDAHVQFSSCALTQALRNKRVPVVARRGWADLF
jgi:hypothetical protein